MKYEVNNLGMNLRIVNSDNADNEVHVFLPINSNRKSLSGRPKL